MSIVGKLTPLRNYVKDENQTYQEYLRYPSPTRLYDSRKNCNALLDRQGKPEYPGKTCPNKESQRVRKSPEIHMNHIKTNGKVHEI